MYLRSNNWTLILSILCPLLMRSQHIAKAVSPIKYDCQFRSSGRPTMYVVWSDTVRASVCVGVKKQLTARDWVGHGWSAKKRWQWLEVAVAGALEPARHASVKWIIMLGVRVCVYSPCLRSTAFGWTNGIATHRHSLVLPKIRPGPGTNICEIKYTKCYYVHINLNTYAGATWPTLGFASPARGELCAAYEKWDANNAGTRVARTNWEVLNVSYQSAVQKYIKWGMCAMFMRSNEHIYYITIYSNRQGDKVTIGRSVLARSLVPFCKSLWIEFVLVSRLASSNASAK